MGFTVLIVDDELMPRTVLCRRLPWAGLGVSRVEQASDGEEGLEQARQCRPDIVISDIKMPRKNGLEMAAAVREFLPACQFVFLSGYSDKEYLKGAIRVKAASYVEKPIDLEEIEGVLHGVLEELQAQAGPDPRRVFGRGTGAAGAPLNDRLFSGGKSRISELDRLIKHQKRPEAEAALRRLEEEMFRCEGTDPEYLRHVYCQIVFLFLAAAESHNITTVTEKTDFLLYTAARQETLAQLWEALWQTEREYFAVAEPQDMDVPARVERYLEQRYPDSGLTIQQMAADLGFAHTYLCAAYKKSCGKTINQRLTELRLQHAKELLVRSRQKLYEVANAVGYGDGKYFVKLFTRETGLSPRQYRARHCHEE